MTPYTEEQILIRSMPCPKCGALPRQHCHRKPSKDGRIKNHNERQLVWHEHVKICKREMMYFQTHYVATTQKSFDEIQEYESLLEPYE